MGGNTNNCGDDEADTIRVASDDADITGSASEKQRWAKDNSEVLRRHLVDRGEGSDLSKKEQKELKKTLVH